MLIPAAAKTCRRLISALAIKAGIRPEMVDILFTMYQCSANTYPCPRPHPGPHTTRTRPCQLQISERNNVSSWPGPQKLYGAEGSLATSLASRLVGVVFSSLD